MQSSHHNVYDSDRDLAQAIGANSASYHNQELLEQTRVKRYKLCYKMLTTINAKYNSLGSDFKKLYLSLREVRTMNSTLFNTAKVRLEKEMNEIETNATNQSHKFQRNYETFLLVRKQQWDQIDKSKKLLEQTGNALEMITSCEKKCVEYLTKLNTLVLQGQETSNQLSLVTKSNQDIKKDIENITAQIDTIANELKNEQIRADELTISIHNNCKELDQLAIQTVQLSTDIQSIIDELENNIGVQVSDYILQIPLDDLGQQDILIQTCKELVAVRDCSNDLSSSHELNTKQLITNITASPTSSPSTSSQTPPLSINRLESQFKSICDIFQINVNNFQHKLLSSQTQLSELEQQYSNVVSHMNDLQSHYDVNMVKLPELETKVNTTLPNMIDEIQSVIDTSIKFIESKQQHELILSKIALLDGILGNNNNADNAAAADDDDDDACNKTNDNMNELFYQGIQTICNQVEEEIHKLDQNHVEALESQQKLSNLLDNNIITIDDVINSTNTTANTTTTSITTSTTRDLEQKNNHVKKELQTALAQLSTITQSIQDCETILQQEQEEQEEDSDDIIIEQLRAELSELKQIQPYNDSNIKTTTTAAGGNSSLDIAKDKREQLLPPLVIISDNLKQQIVDYTARYNQCNDQLDSLDDPLEQKNMLSNLLDEFHQLRELK